MIIVRQIRNVFRWRKTRKIDWVFLDLDTPLIERPEPSRGFIQKRLLPPPKLSLAELRQRLHQLAKFSNIQGLVLHLRTLPKGNAQIQSLRATLEEFKAAGKKIVVFAHSYGFTSYYVASVADQVYLQTGGSVDIIGLEMSKVFLKDFLSKYKIEMDVVPISSYKSAGDMFRRSSISEEDREQNQRLLDSVYETFVNAIAKGMEKTVDEVNQLIDGAPYADEDAKKLGLIADYINEEELHKIVQKIQQKKKINIVDFTKSKRMLPIPKKKRFKKHIAVISATGMIIPGKSKKPPVQPPTGLPLAEQMGDQTVVRQLRSALVDSRVKAVVLHVNSGGGSAAASEAIRAASVEVRKKKPVVVYFSDVAASGGYYIATAADYIIAQPTTITGSIGVIAMKPVLDRALEKSGITKAYLRKGKRAGYLSPEQAFTEEERALVRESIEHTYELFIAHVADCRKMEKEEVKTLAGGRIWSGKDAYDNGLVDGLGTIYDAIGKAAELIGTKREKCCIRDFREIKKREPMMITNDEKVLVPLIRLITVFKEELKWMIVPEILMIT